MSLKETRNEFIRVVAYICIAYVYSYTYDYSYIVCLCAANGQGTLIYFSMFGGALYNRTNKKASLLPFKRLTKPKYVKIRDIKILLTLFNKIVSNVRITCMVYMMKMV